MGMFDENELNKVAPKERVPALENHFEAAGDDYLDNYLEEIEIPKQDQPKPDLSDDDYAETEEIEQEPYTKQQYETSKVTAFFVVKTIDDLFNLGVAAYTLEKDSKTFAATEGELDEISQHLSVYFAENSFNLPPWAMAAIPASMVLTRKMNMAGKLRKANLETRKAENETAELRREIARLKMEKEANILKQEVESLKDETTPN